MRYIFFLLFVSSVGACILEDGESPFLSKEGYLEEAQKYNREAVEVITLRNEVYHMVKKHEWLASEVFNLFDQEIKILNNHAKYNQEYHDKYLRAEGSSLYFTDGSHVTVMGCGSPKQSELPEYYTEEEGFRAFVNAQVPEQTPETPDEAVVTDTE